MTGTRRGRDAIIEDLIALIYEAALAPAHWADVAPALASATHSSIAALCVDDRGPPLWLMRTDTFGEWAAAYDTYYYKLDVWAQRAARFESSYIFSNQELLADGLLVKTEFYQDWCRPLDIFRVMGSVFDVAEGERWGLGVNRPRRGAEYEEDDKKKLGLILPHLKRALQLRSRLTEVDVAGPAAGFALEHAGVALLVVNRNCRILYANGAAREVLRRGDALKAPSNRLTAFSSECADALDGFVRAAADTAQHKGSGSGGVLLLRRLNRLPVTVVIAPFRPSMEALVALEPAAILVVRDPEMLNPRTSALQGLFGFTPAEAAVASLLLTGQSIKDIAEEQMVSLHTARMHLRHLFVKTGTKRQAELILFLQQSVSVLGRGSME